MTSNAFPFLLYANDPSDHVWLTALSLPYLGHLIEWLAKCANSERPQQSGLTTGADVARSVSLGGITSNFSFSSVDSQIRS